MSDEVTRQAAEAQSERSVSRENYDWMVQNRNEWQQQAEALGGATQRMTLDNCRLVNERDAARDEAEAAKHAAMRTAQQWISDANEKINVLATERDAALVETETLKRAAQRMTLELVAATTKHSEAVRDCERIERFYAAVRADLTQVQKDNHGLAIEVQNMRAGLEVATEERDNWQQRAKALADALETAAQRMTVDRSHLTEERDTAEQQLAMALTEIRAHVAANRVIIQERDAAEHEDNTLREERDAAERERTESRAEVVRLQAERDQALADKHSFLFELERMRAQNEGLRADLLANPPEVVQQQLAYERKLHLDLIEDFKRQMATIASLQSDLEKANKKAYEAKEIEDRLHAVIGQLEDCREELERLRKENAKFRGKVASEEIIGILAAIEANANLAKSKIYSR